VFTSFSRGRKVKENQTNNSPRRSKNTAAPLVDGNSMTPTFDLLSENKKGKKKLHESI
jgi:hypothetical protein